MKELSASFANTLASLRESIDQLTVLPDPHAGFALFSKSRKVIESDRLKLAHPWPHNVVLKHPQALSCFGFMIGIDPDYHSELQAEWKDACRELFARNPFPVDRQSFVYRPVEVLGLAVGIVNSSDQALVNELRKILEACPTHGNADAWSQLMYWFAGQIMQDQVIPPPLSLIDDSIEVNALVKWMSMADIRYEFDDSVTLVAEERVLKDCLLGHFTIDNATVGTVLATALESSLNLRIEARLRETAKKPSTVEEASRLVSKLCRNFPLFARQLQKRRKDVPGTKPKEKLPRATIEMKDEYDVQDAFHALLLLFFDDVRAESWTPEYAANQNRIDFVLPDFGIAIEVKHTGNRLTQRDVADQLIVDERYYRMHEHCDRLICFVFDPKLRLKNPLALEKDLAKDEADFQVSVIVSPQGR